MHTTIRVSEKEATNSLQNKVHMIQVYGTKIFSGVVRLETKVKLIETGCDICMCKNKRGPDGGGAHL